MTQSHSLSRELKNHDDKLMSLVAAVNSTKLKRDFFKAFSDDPVGFFQEWKKSQEQDAQVWLGDVCGDVKDDSFFSDEKWVQEAVFRYLNEQTR